MNNTVYTSKEKNYQFSFKKKKPFALKHSPLSNVYYMEFFNNFLFKYILMGIVKPGCYMYVN